MKTAFRESDYIGKRFGRLIFLKNIGTANRMSIRSVLVICDCGTKKIVLIENLKKGRTKSCGCSRKHNIPKSIRYSYSMMKSRCYNSKDAAYKSYGGRGIRVCKKWLQSIGLFYQNMGDRPSGEYSLDRINNNGNYKPSNCRWATQKEQCNNTRLTCVLTAAKVAKETNYSREWIRRLANKGKLNNFIESEEIVNANKRYIFNKQIISFLNKKPTNMKRRIWI